MGSIEAPPNSILDVAIVGAGPVGLALALDLGKRGIHTTVFERKPRTSSQIEAKASVINERTMEYLRRLGCAREVANSGYPKDLPGDTVFCTALHDKYIGRLEMDSAEKRELPEQSSEMLQRCPQCWFDPILARAVVKQKMTEMRYGFEVSGCEQDANGVTLLIKNAETGLLDSVRARYVVACDGPGSAIRKSLGIDFQGKDLGLMLSSIVEADINGKPPFGAAAERYMCIGTEGTWGNFTTIDGRNLWRFAVAGIKERIDPNTYDIKPLVKKALGRDDIDFDVKRVLQWRRSQFTADRYNSGRVFLAGDSAHTMSPTGGHGMNTGMGDASDLSWMLQALLEGWGGPNLIAAYEKERRPIAVRNGQTSTKNFAIWQTGKDKILDDTPEGEDQRRMTGENMAANMRQEFQSLGLALGYNYGDSSLVVPDGSEAPADDPEVYIQTARPGHRAPHCWLEQDKSTVDLFGDGFVLLRFGPESADDSRLEEAAGKVGLPLRSISISSKDAAELYERRLALVRPDGMVAWRGDFLPNNVDELVDRVRGVI
ncbi:putative polyketide hydroxylase [Cercospora beticola]|uniref:Putative polyketide hydroxylase n=1 Tax=Cercospora beticola TaxID=122368 RepID=A0A2G5HDM9_CERBT|nr:putative polyketide hydroxylase [Cercospora beticola]PIA90664.1 putative polyketide hydroxylase [Cercospora beticola]WPB08193.1 hypothetical protein RHO25_012857 [Cercospora beticola]CAK1367937.1 unnamed protein product [Cercospora beticola]